MSFFFPGAGPEIGHRNEPLFVSVAVAAPVTSVIYASFAICSIQTLPFCDVRAHAFSCLCVFSRTHVQALVGCEPGK